MSLNQPKERHAGAMIRNRSVLTDVVHVVYKDLGAAIEWLTRALGFVEHYRYGDPISRARARRECLGYGGPQAGRAIETLLSSDLARSAFQFCWKM
jgi:hypothetical protein